MRLSRGNFTTTRERVSNETLCQQILLQSGQLKRYAAGIYAMNNLLVKATLSIEKVIRDVLEKNDWIQISLPTLQPQEIWMESGRWDKYIESDQMFYCNDVCMAPTAEEAFLAFLRMSNISSKNLPITLYQIGNKFRKEISPRGGLLRTNEFIMMDAYSADKSYEDLVKTYNSMRRAFIEIFKKLGLPVIPVRALSGDIGGDHSEEFMHISPSGKDIILVDKDASFAFNTEILENKPEFLTKNGIDPSKLEEKRCTELGHIFQLGQKYSKSMNGIFTGKDNKRDYFYMGCYGIGVSRTLAAICEANCDNDGLKWPISIAPYMFYIVSTDKQIDAANDLYKKLLDNNKEVILDDRNNVSFGAKLKDAKLFGIPYLIIIGNSYAGDYIYEVEERLTGSKLRMSFNELCSM